MDREDVIEEVANWIDTNVIAELLVDTLEEEDELPTVQAVKDAWLSILECLASDMVALTSNL